MNYIDSLLNENNNSTTNSNDIELPDADPLLKQMQQDAEDKYYNQLSGSTYSSEPKKLSLDEIAAKKEARLAKKRDELIEDDSNFTLKAKSFYNTVNNLWDGEDLKANYMGKTHSMSNKIFEDVDATMEESQIRRQELIDQYNMAEDNPNAKHKVYQLRLKEGFDQNGNPIYSYKTGIAETSAAERYKNQYIKDGYEILSEKGFAGAEEWENRWHGLKSNIADRTYDEGINSQGQKIKDLSSIGEGYSEVYNTQAFDFRKTDQEIAQNMAYSQNLSDIRAERLREGYGRGSDSIVDSIQAGALKTLADTGDMILDAVTPGDNTLLNDAKDQTKIDKYVGYNRKTADRAIGEATEYFKNGNYSKAMWEIYKEPQIIAESIPAMAEMLLGFGKFTKAGRLAMGVDAANKAGDVAAASKLTKELAENVSSSQKAMYRVAQNAGLLTFAASQTNNQIEERVKNNQEAGLPGGDSFGEIASVFASNLALYGLDRGLFTKITGIGGGKAALSDAFGFADTKTKKNIMRTVAEKMLATGTAGAAEGSQEWVQTWGEIINQQLGTGANGGKTFEEIIKDSKNIDESIGGMLAGTVGGVQMRQASDTAYTIADKVLGISAGKEYVEEANEREKYTFTSGSNWFDEPLKNMVDPTYDEAVKFNTDIARTIGEIKNTSMDRVANAIFGKTQISDINGNTIMPEDAISNSIDTLRSLHFSENAYNTRIDNKDLEEAALIEDEAERLEKISDIEYRSKARKFGGLNEYSNDMIDTFSNLYQKVSDPKRNQNPENIAKAQDLITQKFLEKINQEQDEEIKNVLLSKFTNELISDLVEKTVKANSGSEVKNKSFGSQPDNLIFSENGDVYIQGLKDIQKKVFGSQMDPNAPLNPVANELNNKIQLFQKEYEEYKRRLSGAATEVERNKIIRAKNASDVIRETVDGAGFIMDITKPNKKSIFGHMNAISKNISRIDSSTRDSYTQAKSNSLTGMLAPIDQLTEFARKKSRNMDVYNDIMAKYQEAQTVEEKLEVARDLFKKGQELNDLREAINLNTTTRAEIEALVKSSIPSYRMDLDDVAKDRSPNNQQSTGSAMIYESRKFIEALESIKAMLLNKIEGKERLLASGSLKSIKSAEGLVRKDIDTMKLKIKLIDSTIEQQVQKIDHIANARILLSDPIVSTELSRLRNNKKDKKTEAKEDINTEVKTEASDETEVETTTEVETKNEEIPAVKDEQEIDADTNDIEQNTEENINENVEPEMAQEINETNKTNEINQGEVNEEFNRENESRGRGEEDRTEQAGDIEAETKNQERQAENEGDGSRSETTSSTREKDSRETSEVIESEKDKYKKYRNEVIERAEKILSDNPGMTISKATEIAISDIVEENYEDSNYSFDDEYASNADVEYKEINDEIKSLKREIFEIENAEKSIDSAKEKKSKIEESKQRAIDVAKRIFARRKITEERLNDLKEEISQDEARLKELEFQHYYIFKMSENEKKIVSKVINKEDKKSKIEKDTEKISKIGKSVELKNKKIAEIDSKIEMLEKINSNKEIKDKRKSEINQRLRELNYRKEKIKYNLSENKDNDITLALKEYNQTMDKLDNSEVGSREYTELSLASKTSFRRYLNEKIIDKEIRKNIIESLESRIEKDKSPFKEENKKILEKAIEDVKNYNIYQDLAKNKYTILGYVEKNEKKEPIDRPLVLKGDIPQYLVDYSNMDNSSKGYIKLKLSKKQFSERLRDGILKSDDKTTIETKVLENYYKMKGNSYRERINMLYPTERELKSFESVLLNQLAFVFQAKTIDNEATFMKPVSLSPENFREVNGKPELSEDAKAFNSKYKKELDNPSISIENGQIVAKIKDENGIDIVLDNNMYDINTLALIFGTKEKNAFGTTANFVTVPDYAEEIMRTELIREIGNMYSVQYIDPDQNDGEDFNNIWGVDPLDDRAEDLRYFIKDTFADKGYIPASVIIKSLGEKIYKALPMSFDKSNIEKDAEAKIANQLAIYALSAVSRKNSLVLSIYTSQEDLDNNELIQGKINDTMTANIPVATSMNEVTGEEATTVSKLNLIRLNQNQAKDLIALSSVLEYTDPSREGTMPSDKPIETTSDTIKNKTTPKSELAKETILDYQSVGYRIEKNIKELYDLWKNEKTRNFAYQIAGILNPDAKLNAREYRKKLSKNKNERIQFDVIMRFFEEKGNDKEFYIKWDMIASGRYMEDSRITPQNNKITRFLLSTVGTRTEIEFTKDEDGNISLEPEVVDGIRKSLAQSLDYGLDKDLDTFVIEKMSKDIVINDDGSIEFKDTEKGKILKQAFNAFLASVKDDNLVLNPYKISRIKKLHDVGEGFHAYQAVRELAKFSSERETFISGSESNHKYDAHFVTEADGITSGMMIILSQMMTDSAKSLFEKGGIYTKEAVKFWTHTAKALGLEEELKTLGKNTLKDGTTQQKITHGLLNRIGKIVSDKESGGEAKAKLKAYWKNVGIKDNKMIDELVERANFKDFYNTVAHSVTGKIKSMKNEINIEIKKLENEEKQKGALEEWQERKLYRLKAQYALIDVVGDEIARSMAKDPVMVFIYGSSLGSIKNKILNGLIGDSIQNILNNPEKIKEELTRKDGSQSLGMILQSIGIQPYVENGEIVLELDKKVKVFDIVNTKGIDDLVEVKKDKIPLKDSNKIFVSSEMLGELFQASFATYGNAFEESFKENFGFINRYRDILKAIEIVRFQVFDKKFEEKVNALINKMSYTDSNGNRIEYNPTNGELDIILKELVEEGFGHVIRDINGGYHSFEKTERSNSDKRYSLRTIHNISDKASLDSTTANSLGIRQQVSNVGAAPVTSIHNQDGWQIRYATIKKNLGVQNIFDALISGLKNHDEAVEMYNNGFAIANSLHSILETQLSDMEKIIDSLSETDRKNMFENMSEQQAKDIIFVYDKIRNTDNAIDAVKFTGEYKNNMSNTEVKQIANPEIELNISVNSMLDNSADIIKAASTPLEDVSIGHLYATDSAPQYVGSLGGIKDTKANPETVFNAFFELIGNALTKSGRFDSKINRRKDIASFTDTKYLVENKILNDEKAKSKIMKTFDTMINKKVSDNSRAEINNIIEKLVNCKP